MTRGSIQTAIERGHIAISIDKAARASERAAIIEALRELADNYQPRDSMDPVYDPVQRKCFDQLITYLQEALNE